MNKLRDTILNRKTPENGAIERFNKLVDELEEIKRNAKRDIEQAIKDVTQDNIFKDLEPAKKLAQDVARAEIADFKKETNERVRNVLQNVENTKKEIMERIDAQIEKTAQDFLAEAKALLVHVTEQSEGQMGTCSQHHTEQQETVRKEMAATVKKMEQIVRDHATDVEKLRGPQGVPGMPGAHGVNGSPDTALEIADKLNTTKESLEIKVIKGLDQRLLNLQKVQNSSKGGSKGGGMGNVQHETKSVSSGTTSVQTSYPIAGGGYAIWAYYQGQLIMRGTHYTVGTDKRTLSLTFTPDDSTSIDIIYLRG